MDEVAAESEMQGNIRVNGWLESGAGPDTLPTPHAAACAHTVSANANTSSSCKDEWQDSKATQRGTWAVNGNNHTGVGDGEVSN